MPAKDMEWEHGLCNISNTLLAV